MNFEPTSPTIDDAAESATGTSTSTGRRPRVLGLDVARSLAILGIFIAHYSNNEIGSENQWPDSVRRFTDGRALPVFVLLAGVGFTFLTRRGAHPVREVLGRSVLLFLAGLLFEGTTTIFLILQFYAIYFVAALAFRKLSDRALLWSAGLFVVGGWILHTFGTSHMPNPFSYLDYGLGHDFGAISMVAHPKDLFTSLLLNGTYAFIPTFAFFLVGMWVGRQDLGDLVFRKRLGLFALAATVVSTGIGLATEAHRHKIGIYNGPLAMLEGLDNPASRQPMTFSRALWSITDSAGHSNMPMWMIAATGFALVVIVACLYFAERFVGISTVFAHAGQLALTAYLGHIMLRRWVFDAWPYGYSPAKTLGLIVLGFVIFTIFATLWRRKFTQGPLEMLLRMAGSVAAGGTAR